MFICENCKQDHDGTYGSGRFCSSKCARGFSTKAKRQEINKKVSKTLTKEKPSKFCLWCNAPINHIRTFCSIACGNHYYFSMPENREKYSIMRTKKLEENTAHCKWFTVKTPAGKEITVQGTWEYRVASRLSMLGYEWQRPTLIYQKVRRYTPDFYIPSLNIYIEVKGWMRERDKQKMYAVLDEHIIDLRILEDLSTLNDIDIASLPKFIDSYPRTDIDMTKFINRW